MDEFGPLPTDHLLAAQGQYFVATNPTPGTGVKLTSDTVTAYSTQTPAMVLQMAKNANNKRRIYLRYLKLLVTNAGAGLTTLRVNFVIDSVARYSSGGTTITPVNVNGTNITSEATLKAVGPTATAGGSTEKLLGHDFVSTVIPVVNDQFIFNFGPIEHAIGQGANNLAGTNARLVAFTHHPIVIPPGGSFLPVFWAGNMSTSPSVEFEMGWFER